MLSALAFLASKSIIHRDLKPDNILSNGCDSFYLTDFGVATYTWRQGGLIGVNKYAAPELVMKYTGDGSRTEVGVDVWALGIVGLQLLSRLPTVLRSLGIKTRQGTIRWFQDIEDEAHKGPFEIREMLTPDVDNRKDAKDIEKSKTMANP